nr:MAG TPA: hypothetical protein [Microviridae sp.]
MLNSCALWAVFMIWWARKITKRALLLPVWIKKMADFRGF